MKLNINESTCGSGKTEKIVKNIIKCDMAGVSTINVCSGKLAQTELLDRLPHTNRKPYLINTHKPLKTIQHHNDYGTLGHFIICSQLFVLVNWKNKQNYVLSIDENFSMVEDLSMIFKKDTDNHGKKAVWDKLHEDFTAIEFNDGLYRLIPNDNVDVNSSVTYQVKSISAMLMSSPNHDILVNKKHYDTFHDDNVIVASRTVKHELFNGWKAIRLSGAKAGGLDIALHLKKAGHDIVLENDYTPHTQKNGKLYWMYNHKENTSATFHKNNIQKLDELSKVVLGDDEYLLSRNEKDKKNFFDPKAEILPHEIKSLNKKEWTSIHNFRESGAYNFSPHEAEFYRLLGWTNSEIDELQTNRALDAAYQRFMRSSKRLDHGKDDSNFSKIIMDTQFHCEVFKSYYFPNFEIERIAGSEICFPDKVTMTRAERNRRDYEKKVKKERKIPLTKAEYNRRYYNKRALRHEEKDRNDLITILQIVKK